MISIDTNVLVRLATADDPHQYQLVLALLKANRVAVPITVTLELEWVLRARYRFTPELFNTFLKQLQRLPQVHLEHAVAIERAADAHLQGLDFADALHCARSNGVLHTFDQKLAKHAEQAGFQTKLIVTANNRP